MEDFIEFLKTALTVLAVVIFVAIGILFYASSKVENSYQSALKNMEQGKWSMALSNFEQIPNYKDASDLYIYAYPHNIYYGNYKSIDERVAHFKEALSFIKFNKERLKGTHKSKYTSDLLELEKVLNFKLVVLNVKNQNTITEKDFNESVQLIKNGNFQNALQKLNMISDNSLYGSDKKQLISYINLQNAIKLKDEAVKENKQSNKNIQQDIAQIISTLNPNYTGPLYQEIQKSVQAFMDFEKWSEVYNKDKSKDGDKSIDKLPQNQNLAIGMKEENVLQILGNPLKQNVINNKYGVFKELTYSNNTTLYFEDSSVIAIKG